MNGNFADRAAVATKVSKFVPTFPLKNSVIYPNAPSTVLTKGSDAGTYVTSLIPGNTTDDDCPAAINYYCIDPSTGSGTALGNGFIDTMITGLNLQITMATESGKKSRALNFFLSLDQNKGNTAFSNFRPTKVVAYKDTTVTRPYGSMISNPTIYADPNGGTTTSPFYTSVAPMISAVGKNIDTQNDQKLLMTCMNCFPTCDSTYPSLCTTDVDENTVPDFFDCYDTTDETLRRTLGCISPQGSINDRDLNPTDNQIDPKLVFMDNTSLVKYSYNLAKSCVGSTRVLWPHIII